jgi:hypothetical protein
MNCFDPFIFATLFSEIVVILLISNENVRKKPNETKFLQINMSSNLSGYKIIN